MYDQTVIRFHLGKPVIGEKGQGLELVGKIQEQTGKQSLVPGFYSSLHIKEADQKDTGQNDPAGHRIEEGQFFLKFPEHLCFLLCFQFVAHPVDGSDLCFRL